MKKCIKVAAMAACAIITAESINRIIFSTAGKRTKSVFNECSYDWKFGEIRYVTAGKKNARPVLLLHDINAGGGLYEWNKTIAALSKKYRVYAVDLIGFGYSEKVNQTYSSYMYVSLVNDFIRHVIKDRTTVITNGLTAQFAVAAYMMNPEMFRKMLLIAPEGFGDEDEKPSSLFKRLLEVPILGSSIYNILTSRVSVFKLLMLKGFSDPRNITPEFVREAHRSAHYGGKNSISAYADYKAGYLNTDISRLFCHVDIPVHVVWGERNLDNPVENFERLERVNPYTSLSIFAGAKKYPHIEFHNEFIRECFTFIR